VSDYISDQLRATAAALRASIVPAGITYAQVQGAQLDAHRAAQQAAAEQVQTEATAEWEQLRERMSTTPEGLTLRELLDTHKPYLGEYSYRTVCEHCFESSYDIEHVEWPCESYAIIKEGMS
jgi:hypothetical protein